MLALGEAFRLIRSGYQDAVIVGGLDFNLNPNVVGGMESFGAVTTLDEFMANPDQAMRPFDSKRAGTVLGDGGGALVLMAEDFHTKMKEEL